MQLFGFTLNVLTLMGLSLAIGMLIDDAIVVRENIVRHMQRGKDHFDGRARRHGGDRPRRHGHHVHDHRGVHPGRVHGRHGRPVLLPVRHHGRGGGAGVAVRRASRSTRCCRRAGTTPTSSRTATTRLRRPGCCSASTTGSTTCTLSYERLLGWALRHRWAVLGVARRRVRRRASRSSAILGGDFMPDFNRGEYQVAFKATPGATLRETGERAREMVRAAARRCRTWSTPTPRSARPARSTGR